MTVQLRAGGSTRASAPPSQRVLDASAKLERNALAGALAHERLRPLLAELTPDHFYDPVHRAIRSHIVEGTVLDEAGVGLLAELDARAVAEGIDDATGEELIWRLRERQLRRELQHADPEKTKELTVALQRLLERVAALSS
jgi:hypothetical protein